MGFSRSTAIIVAVYLALTTIIVAVSGAESFSGPNRYGTYPALALLENGAFVHPFDVSQPYTGWPPGFPIFMVPFIWIEGGETLYTMLGVFVLLHLGMGLVLRRIVEDGLPGFGDLALALLLFNPNSLAAVHNNGADHLSAVLVMATIAAAYFYLRRPSLVLALAIGALLGTATLVRPVTQYLNPLLPLALPLCMLCSGRLVWRRDVMAGLAALAVAVIVVLPWSLHMQRAGEGIGLASAESQALFLVESVATVEVENGISPVGANYGDVKVRIIEERDLYLEQMVPGWDQLTLVEQSRHDREYMYEYIGSHIYDWTVYLRATLRSWLRTLVSGGEGDLLMVFNTDPVASQNQGVVYGFKVVAIAFSLSLRLLGILGLIALVRRKEYGLLLLLVSLAAYVAVAHLTVGRPRFRVPIEAPLALLALYGVAWLRQYFPLRSLRPST